MRASIFFIDALFDGLEKIVEGRFIAAILFIPVILRAGFAGAFQLRPDKILQKRFVSIIGKIAHELLHFFLGAFIINIAPEESCYFFTLVQDGLVLISMQAGGKYMHPHATLGHGKLKPAGVQTYGFLKIIL